MSDLKSTVHITKVPPSKSRTVFSDARLFLINRPEIQTLVSHKTEEERKALNNGVLQRIGENIDKNTILNIHKIGINAPVSYVFNELLNWNGDSTCWPNHVAKVERVNGAIENIRILPFGFSKYPFGFKKSFLGMNLIPLFYMTSIRIKSTPDAFDFDNARYLLYRCSGGYPIGIFVMYVRSSIPELGEKEKTQLIFGVSFNFYGKEKQANRLVNKTWEFVHNRVTSNVLNRIKQLSEWRIEKLKNSFEYL